MVAVMKSRVDREIDATEVIEIPLKDLVIDRRYQRALNEIRAAKIAEEFNPVLCGVLDVSALGDGKYAVIDGQHRIAAMHLRHIEKWWCKVSTIDEKQQATAFVALQQTVQRVHACDQHKAAVFAGDKLALAIDRIAEANGYRITTAGTLGALCCPRALRMAHERYGAQALNDALAFTARTWGRDDHSSRKAPIVTGLSILFNKYEKDIDRDSLSAKLSETPSARILREAASRAEIGSKGTTAMILVARTLVEHYNKGRRNKLSMTRLGRGA